MQLRYGRQHILLPVKPGFIVASIGAAFALNLLPWQDLRGVPDLLALVIAFWCVHQPRRVGIGVAWTLGLIMDAANGTLFGQYALAYASLAYGAHTLHRRILRFPLWQQALHVLVLLLAAQLLMLGVRLVAGGTFPGFAYFTGSLVGAALWPAVTFMLLAPQRRAADVDQTRPI
jgi:rod shape-determining protein MreD